MFAVPQEALDCLILAVVAITKSTMKAASIQKEIIDNYFNQLQHYGYTNINKSQQVLFAVLLLDAFDLFSDMLDVQFEKDVRRIMRKLECCMCELPLGLVDGSVEGESYTQGWWELVSPTYGAEMVLALQKEIDKKVDRDELAQVAFTGNYGDLEGKPEINNGKLTIKQNGTLVAEFTANQAGDVEADITGSGVQPNWTQTDSDAPDFIKHKPIVEGTLSVDITEIHNPRYSTTGLDDLKEAGIYDFRVRLNDSGVVYEYDLPLSVEKIAGTPGTQEAYIQRITVLPLFYAFLEIPALYTEIFRTWSNEAGEWSGWQQISLADVALSGDYYDLRNTPTIGDGMLTVQKNGTLLDAFSANATTNKTINITVPTQASDISALPDTTKYGSSFTLSIDSSTYVVTATLKDQDGNTLGSAQTIDLPLESVVVGGSYDDTTKKVILTLQNGSTVEFSVADLVAGLQSEITANNKLSADLVDDTNTTNKFATASQLSKLDGLQNITAIGSNLSLTNGTLSATDTTYNNFTGADGTNAGAAGLVPAPAATDNTKFLKGDGTWAEAGASVVVVTFTNAANNTSTGSMTANQVLAEMALGKTVIGMYYNNRYVLRVSYAYSTGSEVHFEGVIGGDYLWTFTGTGNLTTYTISYIALSPTVGNGTLTITQNGTTVGTFTANQSTATTVALTAGIRVIDYTGD